MKRLMPYGSITFALAMLFAVTASAAGPAPVDLGEAGEFAILSTAGITDTGASAITGDVGASPITGAAILVTCPEVAGTIFSVDVAGPLPCRITDAAYLTTAVSNMQSAYTNAAGRAPNHTELGAGNISGLTLAPGVYQWSTGVDINTNVTLHGGANDVWIFQIAGNLNIASGASVPAGIKVVLDGGAQASNVFWQVGGGAGAILGTYSTFNGTILSATAVVIQTGAVLNGRALAQTNVTLDANTVTLTPSGAVPIPKGGMIYDSTVNPLPGNMPSVGAEAYAFNEFGDDVTFAGNARLLTKVTVTLSSWACQTGHWNSGDCVTKKGAKFKVPITLNIYARGNFPGHGALIASKTQTFDVPYRPSADNVRCTDEDSGKWFKSAKEGCYNGLANEVTFSFNKVPLPESVVYGISYNTTSYGPSPIGTGAACFTSSGGCFYDSLNIGLSPAVLVGTKDYWNTVYQNTSVAGVYGYCDGGSAGLGSFRLDSPTSACWFDDEQSYIPAVAFKAVVH